MDREASREEFKLWANQSVYRPGFSPRPGHSPTALPPGNMVTALSFCFPICKLSKWDDTWCPLALVSAEEEVVGTQHLGLNKASFQAVEASHLSEQSWPHLYIFLSLNSVTPESLFI